MIGNDIVDLELAAVQSNWRRKGFLHKVFTDSERELIASSENQDLFVWLLWSMKEAAYKAHQRRFSLPRRLDFKFQECTSIGALKEVSEGVVTVGRNRYHTWTRITSVSLHTIAVEGPGFSFKKGFFQLPSSGARANLLRQISEGKKLALDQLSIEKNCAGIPYISYKNQWLPLPFSLSAHGRFSGFCHPLMNS